MAGRRPAATTAAAAAPPRDVRAQVLAASTRLFAWRGFDATSLQAIADEVGVAKQSVLHYFPTKDELRRAVFDQILAHWREALPRLLLEASAGGGRFDALMGELIGFYRADPDRARLLVRETLDRPAEMRALLGTHVRPWLDAVAEHIRAGQERGEVHADLDPEAYVFAVLQMVVAGVALGHVAAPVLAPAAGAASASRPEATRRYERELVRIARASLYAPPPLPQARRLAGARRTPRRKPAAK